MLKTIQELSVGIVVAIAMVGFCALGMAILLGVAIGIPMVFIEYGPPWTRSAIGWLMSVIFVVCLLGLLVNAGRQALGRR